LTNSTAKPASIECKSI